MRKFKRLLAGVLALSIGTGLAACGSASSGSSGAESTQSAESSVVQTAEETTSTASAEETASAEVKKSSREATTEEVKTDIENTLNMATNKEITWTYDQDSDSWTSSITSAVADPELEEYQGVSVNVPGAYVTGIDSDGDGQVDVTAENASDAVTGTLIVNHEGTITNENGQTYTADTAPVVINTGAAGYSAAENTQASTANAAYGYINVACGNRGKQSTATDESGNTYYTGDAPLCLVDQKNAIRFVKYNILLGNLPGSVDFFVSTGGSGGGAHAAMVAATGNNADFFDYEAEAGAVGVYVNEDGTYSNTVTIQGEDIAISDGVWGCVAYSAITSLQEADMAMAFEYNLDTDYSFNTSFQKQLAEYLSSEYMEYINDQNLTVEESAVGFDLNEDGDIQDTIDLKIEYDESKYADTNGYGGSYLDLYLDEFKQNLTWYLDNLEYAEDWTWFGEDGTALTDAEVASMTTEDRIQAFLEGRYAKSETKNGFPGGGAPMGGMPTGEMPTGEMTTGGVPTGGMPTGAPSTGETSDGGNAGQNGTTENVTSGMGAEVGTPDSGTTQSAGSSIDSSDYADFEEMLQSYETDIASVEAGDKYGNNIVSLYNPLNYIGAEGTDAPTWTRIMMGAAEGDMSLFCSLNLQLAWLNNGTDAELEWQWDGGHVPSEIFGESLALYIDEMYGKYVSGATPVTKPEAEAVTKNGTAEEATGTDISSWAEYQDNSAEFTLQAAAAYRVNGASKAVPGFDVMDYGQETYEFGNSTQDARHFDTYVLQALQEHADTLSGLFNKAASNG